MAFVHHPGSAPAGMRHTVPETGDSSRPYSVLLVDDDPDYHGLMGELVARIGPSIELRCVTGYDTALAVLREESVDLCLADYLLGARTGIDLVREVVAERLRVPVIVLTAHGNRELDLAAMSAGAVDYLVKGELDERQLERAIRYGVERARAREEHLRVEERFRMLIENARDVITVVDVEGIIRYQSPSVVTATGYTPEDLVGRSIFNFIHPEDLPGILEGFESVKAQPGTVVRFDYRWLHAGGGWRNFESVARNLLADRSLAGIVVNTRDVTERVEGERLLRFKAEILNTVGQAVISIDLDGRVTYWNRFAEELYGWTRDEAIGAPAADLLVSAGMRPAADPIMAGLRRGERWAGEFTVHDRNGREFPVMVTNTPYFDEEGGLAGFIGISADVTERRQAEDALRASERRFRALIEHGWDAVTMLGVDGIVRYASSSVPRVIGYRPEEYVGTDGFAPLHPEDREHVLAVFAEVLEHPGATRTAEFRYGHKSGEWVWIEATGTNLAFDPAIGAIVVNFRDITERKRTEGALREAYDSLERRVHERTAELALALGELELAHERQRQFVADASHDLRTPLTVLRAELDLLVMHAGDEPGLREALQPVVDQTRRLERLSANLLTLASLDARSASPNRTTARFDEQVLECIVGLTPIATEREIVWDIELDEPVMVRCDVLLLRRAIANVLENAIKYSPRGSSVHVRIESDARSIVLAVIDEGPGIAPEDLPRIFDRFYRGDGARSTDGTGLGLAIVKGAVELHGGSVELRPADGGGTEARITLPRAEASA